MKFLSNLYNRFFGEESAALVSKTPAYYYEMYEDEAYNNGKYLGYSLWLFSWYDEGHSVGEVLSFPTLELAEYARDKWLKDMKLRRMVTVRVS